MSEFLILFAKVLGVATWIATCITFIFRGAYCKKATHGALLLIAGVLLILLGFTFEIYGLNHWWLK